LLSVSLKRFGTAIANTLDTGGITMARQFENPEETKLEDETVSDTTAQQRIERVAEKAAKKSSKDEQHYDKDHDNISN
jgi:hypothetical protein